MKRKYKIFSTGVIIIGLIVIGSTFMTINHKRNVNGNSEVNIKKSIAYLHKDYISTFSDINIIDEFKYEEQKVVFFNYGDLNGIAKFYEDKKGNYKIGFVETLNKESDRQRSKVS